MGSADSEQTPWPTHDPNNANTPEGTLRLRSKLVTLTTVALALSATAIVTAPESEATPTVVATCTGMRGLAKITPGLSNVNQAATVSTKGVLNVGGTLGSCTYSHPLLGTGTKQMTKWSSKSASPAIDCIADVDPSEYPSSGKSSTTFDDLTKTDSYVAGQGTKAGTQAVQVLSGIVIKGAAAGAFLSQEVWTVPVVKDTAQLLDWNGTPDIFGPLYPKVSIDLANGAACIDNTGATAGTITGLLVGTGQSPIYAGDFANGTTLTIGV